MKLLDIQRIPIARRNSREPHYFHKLLNVAVEMVLKPKRLYWIRRRRHHLGAAPPNSNPKPEERNPPADKG
jgi:hypothetical protein